MQQTDQETIAMKKPTIGTRVRPLPSATAKGLLLRGPIYAVGIAYRNAGMAQAPYDRDYWVAVLREVSRITLN